MAPDPASFREIWRGVFLPGAIASGILLTLYLLSVEWAPRFPRDIHGYALGRDFLNFWTYGREAWSGEAGRFYDIGIYNAHLQALVGADYQTQQWSYPPHLILLMAPFGLLPYLPAYAFWTALGVAALFWSLPNGTDRRLGALALALAPAGLICLVSGQNAFFAVAIFAGVFRFLDTRPILAGVLLGLLTVKPQLGLLLPLMLVVTGRWTVFASAAATTIALFAATALLFGPDIWTTYLRDAIPLQEYVIRDPTRATMGLMPTAYMNARIVGLSAETAYAVQAVFAALALGAVVWTYSRPRDPLLSYAVLITATLSATPYLMSYDFVVLSWVLLALAAAERAAPGDRRILLAVQFVPFLAIAGELAGVPGAALILPGLAAVWLLRLRGSAPAGAAVPLATSMAREGQPEAIGVSR